MNTATKYCAKCNGPSVVIDSMSCRDGSVRRIRHCRKCFAYWETVEVIVEGSDRISLPRGNVRTKK